VETEQAGAEPSPEQRRNSTHFLPPLNLTPVLHCTST
jgi:hypothetical protein